MFALRRPRIPNTAILLRRSNTGLQASVSSEFPSPPPTAPNPVQPNPSAPSESNKSTTQGRRRRRREPIPPQRPDISAANPRKWNRPLAKGVLPAYDLALKVIRADSVQLHKEAAELKLRIAEKEKQVLDLGGPTTEVAREGEEALEKMREKLYILQVQSEINLPHVRWKVANAMGTFFSIMKVVVVDLGAQWT